MSRAQKGQVLIFIVLAIVIAGFASAFFYVNNLIPKSRPQDSLITSETPTPTPTAGPAGDIFDKVINWKTYTNTKYNYSIQYPEDTEVVECKPERVYPVKKERHFDPCQSGAADVIFSIDIKNEDMTSRLPDWYYQDYKINKSATSLGDKSATKFLGTRISNAPAPIPNPISIITLSYNGKTLFINNADSGAQILSTFKFLQ